MNKNVTLLLIVIFLFSLFTFAQAPPELNFPTYKQDADATFGLFNPTYVPTHILYDRVYPIASLQNFNDGITDTTQYSHFLKSANELQNASYVPLTLITPERMLYFNRKASIGDTVQIGVLDFNFNLIAPTSDTNIVHNPQNYVSNGQYSFLVNKSVTIAAALAEIAYTTNGTIQFNWSSNNNYSNSTKTITSLSINFDDGTGIHNLQPNSSISISYSNEGDKFLYITTYYSNNTSSANIAHVYVEGTNFSGGNQRRIPERETDIPVYTIESEVQTAFQGYDENVASTGKGDIYTYLKSTNGGNPIPGAQLTKPIIVLDGFDPGNVRKGRSIFNQTLEYNGSQYLGDELTDAGNDLIILDFPVYQIGSNPDGSEIYRDGGSDYIERNAMVLVKLIKTINESLITNSSVEEITIIGPSMGGLISRYALAYMERNNIPHNCKLWVSFDSPHLGANIPIGDQLFLGFAAYTLEDADAKEKLISNLNNPAAKQMLIVHNLGFSSSNSNIEQQGAPGFRDRFKTALANVGWPQLRKVAIANGSINGTTTGSPGMTVLDFQYKFRNLASFFLGKSGLISRVRFTGSYGTSSEVFQYFRRTFVLSSETVWVNATFNNVCSIDASPGGTFDTQRQIAEGLPGEKKQQGLRLTLQVNQLFNDHSFIPTISALAVNTGSNDYCQTLYSRNLVCSSETPFDSYYAPVDKNMVHVTFDDDLVSWFKGELNGIPQQATADYASIFPIQLQSGTEPMCTSATYLISLPVGATIIWSTTGGIAIVGTNTGNTVSITSNGAGSGVLTGTISTSCGNFKIARNIEKNDGPEPTIFGLDRTFDCYEEYTLSVLNPQSNWSYNWSFTGNAQAFSSTNGSSVSFYTNQGGPYFDVSLTVSDGCLSTIVSDGAYLNSSSCEGYFFAISPNPASEIVVITSKSEQAKIKGSGERKLITEVNVYDQQGNIKMRQKYGSVVSAKLVTSTLRNGVYFLEIVHGNSREKQKLIILR